MEKIKRELIYSLEKLKFFLSSNDTINVKKGDENDDGRNTKRDIRNTKK